MLFNFISVCTLCCPADRVFGWLVGGGCALGWFSQIALPGQDSNIVPLNNFLTIAILPLKLSFCKTCFLPTFPLTFLINFFNDTQILVRNLFQVLQSILIYQYS